MKSEKNKKIGKIDVLYSHLNIENKKEACENNLSFVNRVVMSKSQENYCSFNMINFKNQNKTFENMDSSFPKKFKSQWFIVERILENFSHFVLESVSQIRVLFTFLVDTPFTRRLNLFTVFHFNHSKMSETDLSLIEDSFFAASNSLINSSFNGNQSTGCQSNLLQNSQSLLSNLPVFIYLSNILRFNNRSLPTSDQLTQRNLSNLSFVSNSKGTVILTIYNSPLFSSSSNFSNLASFSFIPSLNTSGQLISGILSNSSLSFLGMENVILIIFLFIFDPPYNYCVNKRKCVCLFKSFDSVALALLNYSDAKQVDKDAILICKMKIEKENKKIEEVNYKNSKSSGRILIILPLSSSGGCCLSNLEICRFCDSKSLGRILNSQIPKCLEEINKSSRKSASRVISNLCSDKDSSKTWPFEIVLEGNLTSCPSLDKKGNNPLCTFSSNKNFILCRDRNHEIPFRNLGSKVQSCFDMFSSQRRVRFNDLSVTSSIFKHFQNYKNHNPSAFKSGLSVTDFTINDDIIINFDSHKVNEGKEIFKSFDYKEILFLTSLLSIKQSSSVNVLFLVNSSNSSNSLAFLSFFEIVRINFSLTSGDTSESSFLNLPFFAFLPNSTDHLINSCSSLDFNLFNNSSACFFRSSNLSLANSDQLTQTNLDILDLSSGSIANVTLAIYITPLDFNSSNFSSSSSFLIMPWRITSATFTSGNNFLNSANNSSGIDTVIRGIFLPPSIYVNTSKYVQIFKPFVFAKIVK